MGEKSPIWGDFPHPGGSKVEAEYAEVILSDRFREKHNDLNWLGCSHFYQAKLSGFFTELLAVHFA